MLKNAPLLFLVLLVVFSFAQKGDENYSPAQYKTGTCKASFDKIKLGEEITEDIVRKYLESSNVNLKDERAGLKLNYIKESPGGVHYSFTQTFKGIAVYQSEIKVNLDRKNVIRSVFDNSENTTDWDLDVSATSEKSVIAVHPKTSMPVLANRKIENEFFEVLRLNGEIIFQHDLRSYFAMGDSLVRGRIFKPDPLTTAQQFYDTNTVYRDNHDSNAPWLEAQYDTVSFIANFQGGGFTLESDYVRVKDLSTPSIAPATSSTPEFYFDRSQPGFEDVNAFYHISAMQKHVQSMGFDCADDRVEIDAHGADDEDQSYFSPDPIMRIRFGDGGVDDAEDADVCVHEYGHAVSFTAAPYSNSGTERIALDEAFGDYLAGSYSKSIHPFNNFRIMNWDGHNEFWRGRIMNSPDVYPLPSTASAYRLASIWAAALYSIHNEIGRGPTDTLILETHYSYAQNISMKTGAQLLIDADSIRYNGAYFCPIYKHLVVRNLVDFNPAYLGCLTNVVDLKELNIQFFQDGVSFTLLNTNEEKLQLQILNINGQLVSGMELSQSAYHYRNEYLPAGVYLVVLQSKDAIKTFKWCKAQ